MHAEVPDSREKIADVTQLLPEKKDPGPTKCDRGKKVAFISSLLRPLSKYY